MEADQVEKVEKAEKAEKSEKSENVEKVEKVERVESKVNGRNASKGVDISSPRLREPFNDGWKREVVYRATVQPGSKTTCDVYYYTPDGRKLRSGREVSDYLHRSQSRYTCDNFTFFKSPIGMDAPYEVLRDAKQRREDYRPPANKPPLVKEKTLLRARRQEVKRNLNALSQDVAAIINATGKTKTPPKAPAGKENSAPATRVRPTVPEDIRHLFTPCKKPPQSRDHPNWNIQNLESINGKQFVSIRTSPQSADQSPAKRSHPSPELGSPGTSPKRARPDTSETPARASSASSA